MKPNLDNCVSCKGCRLKTIWEVDEDNNTIFVEVPYCHYALTLVKDLAHCPNTPRDAKHQQEKIRFSNSGH